MYRKRKAPLALTRLLDVPFGEGDVLASIERPVKVVKVLRVEVAPGVEWSVFHVCCYAGTFRNVEAARTAHATGRLCVFVGHAPVDGASFVPSRYTRLGREAVHEAELVGYRLYCSHAFAHA